VDKSSPKTTFPSSPVLRIVSTICTTPPFRNEAFLKLKYEVEGMSARQIAVLTDCPHSVINRALARFEIQKVQHRQSRPKFGIKIEKCRREPHVRQQQLIAQMQRLRCKGMSYSKIAEKLNLRKIRTLRVRIIGMVAW
jgi:IS30 family transposase